MQTLTTIYNKKAGKLFYWQIQIQNKSTISFTWGEVGNSLGLRIKNFDTYESMILFHDSIVAKLEAMFQFKPTFTEINVNISVNMHLPLHHSAKDYAALTYPIYCGIRDYLKNSGNGSIGKMSIRNLTISIPIKVIDLNVALNRIREILAGNGIGRNRLSFLPL